MTKEDIGGLLGAYGWKNVLSNNPYMWSYNNSELGARLNVYFTTWTVTIQDVRGRMVTRRAACDYEAIEDMVLEYAKTRS